ncbi:DUF1572 family protein [Paenibacillus aurantius]|uniref:DUF1572 family protein n=1 Tax=Paenibacillus aurantius TaxID=2918900 RepID=A0AA96LAN1_9BACL|nr:DUF1572 family protein [Paenibacillus aurantius]WNQ09705.1 DUF1572 family protein [Paenibacillus aurantius]
MDSLIDRLTQKYRQITKRWLDAVSQLTEEELYWRPTPESNSIANLMLHVAGNVHQRIEAEIQGLPDHRDRDGEFRPDIPYTREELIEKFQWAMDLITRTAEGLSEEDLHRTMRSQGRDQSYLHFFLQSTNHFSEHLGQVLYIAKMKRGRDYRSTSI